MKIKHIVAATITLLFLTFSVKTMQRENIFFSSGLDINCQSRFTYIASRGFANEGVLNVILDRNGTGEFVLNATFAINDNEEHYRAARQVNFDYKLENNGYITIFNIEVYKKPADNTPDQLFNKTLLDLSPEKRKLSVQRINNALLIGNVFSPTIMCVDRRSGRGSI